MADQGSEGLLSPYLRRKRFEAASCHLGGRVLDVGCGSGELAALVDPKCYIGVEVDKHSLAKAREKFRKHEFCEQLPEMSQRFDTVVALAVIEHVSDPVSFLRTLAGYLEKTETARLVITTPHPSVGWVHDFGAAIGVFSKHANEEHEALLNRAMLLDAGERAGLELKSYSRFLFAANQIAVYSRAKI